MEKILKLVEELNDALTNDKRILECKNAEQKMENNKEVILLSRNKELKENAYSDLLKIYKEEDEIVIKARKELFIAKKALDEHPLVRDYIKKYQIARDLISKVNLSLYADIINEGCKHK